MHIIVVRLTLLRLPGTGSRVPCGKPSSRARNFTKVPKPIHHFKAYRTKNDVEMFLTGEIEHKMYCDQQMCVSCICSEMRHVQYDVENNPTNNRNPLLKLETCTSFVTFYAVTNWKAFANLATTFRIIVPTSFSLFSLV